MSSLAFLRKAATSSSEIGSALKSPGLDQRRPGNAFLHRIFVVHLGIHFLALIRSEEFHEPERVVLVRGVFRHYRAGNIHVSAAVIGVGEQHVTEFAHSFCSGSFSSWSMAPM